MKKNNHIKIAYLFFVLFLTFSIGCKKDDSSTNSSSSPSTIYICGITEGSNNLAKCWVNGVDNLLSSNSSEAKCCFFSGNSIYYSGCDFYNGNNVATYWKNGSAIHLPPAPAVDVNDKGEGIYVNNDDVYITQFGQFDKGYWMNTQFFSLSNCRTAGAILINNGDVYVAGTGAGNGGQQFYEQAKYWVNGTEVVLGAPSVNSNATSIKIVGNDIYVAGRQYSSSLGYGVATVWKNGVAIALSSAPSWTYSIDVANGTTYVCGEVKDTSNYNLISTYWKNSQETQLTSSNFEAGGNCIKVNGSDVYIAGYYDGHACYWKNGVINLLPKTSGSATEYANSIWIK